MTRALYLVFFTSFLPALSADGPPLEKEGKEKRSAAKGGAQKGAGPAVKARPAGVSIEHSGGSLIEADRTPEGEMKAILSATAVLKVDRPLRYRSTVLPPGSYPLKISAEGEGRNLFFVIGPAAGSALAKAEPTTAKPGTETPEEKKMEKSPETKGSETKGSEIKGSEIKGAEKRGEPKAGSRRVTAKTIPGQIRAIFHLTAAKEAASRMELSVRPSTRGDRFTLTVKAGASQGKATFKLVD